MDFFLEKNKRACLFIRELRVINISVELLSILCFTILQILIELFHVRYPVFISSFGYLLIKNGLVLIFLPKILKSADNKFRKIKLFSFKIRAQRDWHMGV